MIAALLTLARVLKNSLLGPSTSLRYAQGERNSLLRLVLPFMLSVAHRAKSKHERLFQQLELPKTQPERKGKSQEEKQKSMRLDLAHFGQSHALHALQPAL